MELIYSLVISFLICLATGIVVHELGHLMLVASTSAYAETRCVPVTETEIQHIRETFKLDLFDSDSAKFANVCKRTLIKAGKKPRVAYCGLLNAKKNPADHLGLILVDVAFRSKPRFGVRSNIGHETGRSWSSAAAECITFCVSRIDAAAHLLA
jgi:hypothetical protein